MTATSLRSPTTRAALWAGHSNTLDDGERRWPVVAGIPWLRAGRDEVRERAVAALDDNDPITAAVVLLADADDWWDEPPPPPEQLRAALRAGTLRQAAALLGLGRVGDYLVHRWSDPSWLAVLGITAAHPPGDRPVIDLACGGGHLLRHLALHGHENLIGVDIVFSKLWLARRFVLPRTTPVLLICADLRAPWPLLSFSQNLSQKSYVACHDALYFFDDKLTFVEHARTLAGNGALIAAHCHNANHPAGTGGMPLAPQSWRQLLPTATCYAEEDLRTATIEGRLPEPATEQSLHSTEALGLACDAAAVPPQPALLAPAPAAVLQLNPLYHNGDRRWPGERWAQEYAVQAAHYLPAQLHSNVNPVRHRILLDLPEKW
jgi:SAM-dependent methyltransferase